jgi:uncharacterized membrane protein
MTQTPIQKQTAQTESPRSAVQLDWKAVRRTQEVWIFAAGLFTLFAACIWVAAVSAHRPGDAAGMLSMIGTHLTAGRALGLAIGLGQEMPRFQVILLAMLIECTVVCLFFPLFALSLKRLISTRLNFLTDTMNQIHSSARRQRRRFLRWGIPGLLLFVWFPFFMTGPVVGSVLGFMLGMRAWVVVSTVLCGTLMAIISWTFLIDPLLELTARVGEFVPLLVVLILLVLALAYRLRNLRAQPAARRPPGASGKIVLLLGGIGLLAFCGCGTVHTGIDIHVDVSHETAVSGQPWTLAALPAPAVPGDGRGSELISMGIAGKAGES